jgi:hypothetical protein
MQGDPMHITWSQELTVGISDVLDGPVVLDHDGVNSEEDVQISFTGLV